MMKCAFMAKVGEVGGKVGFTSTHRTPYGEKVLHMVNCPMYHRATPMGPMMSVRYWTQLGPMCFCMLR